MKSRGYNFGAGPAALPQEILVEAQRELLNWNEQGMSILEIGHRTPEFRTLLQEIEQDFRDLLHIPNDYAVLFMGGSARNHFAMLPLNFVSPDKKAGYLITGLWSELAYKECARFKPTYCVASNSENRNMTPPPESWEIKQNTAYLYFTNNETVDGIRLPEVPKVGLPLIVDMTSSLLTEPINVRDYAVIFAGVQKNIANAGMTILIVQKQFLQTITETHLPAILDYRVHVENHSLYATPPVFNCYLAGKMFKWLKAKGGVDTFYHENVKKSQKLYQYIDASDFFYCPVEESARSLVNVCFYMKDSSLEDEFLLKAKENGLLALKGHRTRGGLRASLYNAMPLEGVDALIQFMQDFSRKYY
ncbi:phosphoserine aminotransferase [Legionella adelaidensis]|uniref:Phosphoserine aminotransferase n=1 Tax=Legionella adelaidensis TaxID=45056 RepID=A0A0W0R534_9GAMM|nr:3-phosphoserine/phosphohydroxythreonine transaminase [Legionella adelaidensis]KTC66207.1 phosphoserine aminotransferase [Legionella adelaidensis]